MMKNFHMHANYVDLIYMNQATVRIFFTPDSGKIFYRNKIDSISNVKHPGIFVGTDQYGQSYFLHNHYQIGRPALVSKESFAVNQPVFSDTMSCKNDWRTIVTIGLQQVLQERAYSFHSYNCQTFVNIACNNEQTSEDVNRWGQRIAGGVVTFLILGILFGGES